MDKNLTNSDLAKYDPRLNNFWNTVLTTASLVTVVFGVLIQRSLYKLLQRKRGRGINRIIVIHQGGLLLYCLSLLFSLPRLFYYPLKDVVGEPGCYILEILEGYSSVALSFASFFTTLFRYICIAHDSFLLRYEISPKNVANFLLTCHYLAPWYFFLTLKGVGDKGPETSKNLVTCLGRYHELFDKTHGAFFCQGLKPWTLDWIICTSGVAVFAILSSNVVEAFLLWRSIRLIKSQTNSIKGLISLTSFKNRQREESIMFSVNLWQYILEVGTTVTIGIKLLGPRLFFENIQDGLKVFHNLFFVLMGINFTLLNCFYLLGDHSFQRFATREGLPSALRRAIMQDYEN